MKQRRIFWTPEERTDLIKRTANIVSKQGISVVEALRRAQNEALQPERRRKLITADPKFKRSVKELITSDKAEDHAIIKLEIVKEVLVVPIQLQDLPLEDILSELFRRVFFSTGIDQRVKNMVVAPIAEAVRKEMPNLATLIMQRRKQVVKPKDHLPRVLVVGLLSEQEHEIEKAFEKDIRLSFYKDANINSLRTMASNADRVILMQKFCSHSVQEVAKQVAGKRFMVCSGAVSHLKAILEHLYLEGEIVQ